MKYADGEAFERMGISRSSSWPIVKRTGAGAACAACCGDWSGAGRRAGLLAASTFSERNIAKLASVTVFKRDAPRRRFIGCAKPLVYAYALLFSKQVLTDVAIAAPAGLSVAWIRCVRTAGGRHTPGNYCLAEPIVLLLQ